MKLSFTVFGAPRDISLNVKFGVAPYVRLFFDPLSFEQYGRKEDRILLRVSPDTWKKYMKENATTPSKAWEGAERC